MSSTRTPEGGLPLSGLISRPVLISGGAQLLAAVLAWIWLVANAGDMDSSMSAMPAMHDMPGMNQSISAWSVRYLLASYAMWVLMMVAMMLPSAAPMILLHARIDRGSEAQRLRNSLIFVSAYLFVWALFSALATLAQAGMTAGGLLAREELAISDRYIVAGLLVVAAAWQLTSAKATCLERCQSPIGFVLKYWKPGTAGALRLGLVHGLFCLGCCWNLMLLLFAGGLMNLALIAALAAIVFAEKLAPPSWQVERWIAAGLLLTAGVIIIG